MIHLVETGNIWESEHGVILFNPVSISNSKNGISVFNNLLRDTHPEVYEDYLDYIVGGRRKDLLADIQLVPADNAKLILNAYVFEERKLNLTALVKTLVEMFNLAEEYDVPIAIPISMGLKQEDSLEKIRLIVDTIFEDCRVDVYLYTKIPYSSRIKK